MKSAHDKWNEVSEAELKRMIYRIVNAAMVIGDGKQEVGRLVLQQETKHYFKKEFFQKKLKKHFIDYKIMKQQILKKYCE